MSSGAGVLGRDRRGMTLLEVLVALSILAVIVLLLVASLRVGLRAWEAGEQRAAAQQELRAVVELVTEALAMAYPYHNRLEKGLGRVLLFEGDPHEVRFVTTAPPLTLEASAAPFHAVTLGYSKEDHLSVVEQLVPAEEPFPDGPRSLLSRAVTGLSLAYLDDTDLWRETWDGQVDRVLPRAVRVELTVGESERAKPLPGFIVSLALAPEPR